MVIISGFIFINIVQFVNSKFPFRNTSLSWEERVNDLISRLTLEEIMVQMSRGGSGPHGGPAPAISRLGIDPWSWNTECLRGDGNSGNATAFPQAIGLAASWRWDMIPIKSNVNPSLVFIVYSAIFILCQCIVYVINFVLTQVPHINDVRFVFASSC